MGWIYNNKCLKEAPEGYIGFVYLIVNTVNRRWYVGKKQFQVIGYKQIKKKRKRKKIESNWRDYYSSCKELIEDVEKTGKNRFKRYIIQLCKTKSECSYVETYYIFRTGALHREESYNFWCTCKIRKAHIKNLEITENKLDNVIEKIFIDEGFIYL